MRVPVPLKQLFHNACLSMLISVNRRQVRYDVTPKRSCRPAIANPSSTVLNGYIVIRTVFTGVGFLVPGRYHRPLYPLRRYIGIYPHALQSSTAIRAVKMTFNGRAAPIKGDWGPLD